MASLTRRSAHLLFSHRQHAARLLRERSSAVSGLSDASTATTADDAVVQWENLPGPPRLPLVGTMHVFIGKNKRARLHDVTEELVEKYGKVMRMQFADKRAFSISDVALMEEIYRQEDPVPIRDGPLPWVEYLKGNNALEHGGLLTTQDESWKRKRKAVRALMLRPFAMENFLPIIGDITGDFSSYLERKRDNSDYVEDLPLHLYRFSFEGIVSVMFGERAGCLGDTINERGDAFIDAVSVILEGCFNSLMVLGSLQRKLNTRRWREHRQAWDKGKESTQYFSERMIQRLNNEEIDFTPMAATLMANNKLYSADIEYLLLEFLFGGVDTTSNTLGFLLYLLAAHPEKQEKLRTEILENGENPSMSDLQKMRYLWSCLKETLRLYPILFLNGRSIRNDFISKNGNIQFRAGDQVMFFHYCMSRDPSLWQQPDDFVPERFDRKNTTASSSERQLVSIPFGYGTRGCIGKRIAEAEIALSLIKLLSRFDLSVDSSKPSFAPYTRSLLIPGNQIPIKFTLRQ